MGQRILTVVTLCIGAIGLAVLTISCQEHQDSHPAQTINTAWTPGGHVPTTQIARELGFGFPPARDGRSAAEVRRQNVACVSCHNSDSHTMHVSNVRVSCIDCHGGREVAILSAGAIEAAEKETDPTKLEQAWRDVVAKQQAMFADIRKQDPARYGQIQRASHVQPKAPDLWQSSANPQVSGAAILRESPDYIRFVNPGDLRAAQVACAGCHPGQTRYVPGSMMAHGAMLWGAALYNNGSYNSKSALFGEAYAPDGSPAILRPATRPTMRQALERSLVAELSPMPRWEISQPGNLLRVFERGGKGRAVIGVPNPLDDPGRPEVKLSPRGLGTELRTDPVMIGLQKTRLLDPTLNFLGTNDQPGDYRSSGCSACHVLYANDRSPVHSARWARFGNTGNSHSTDAMVNPAGTSGGGESGHPIHHTFVRQMPTSTCIVCHVHPGTNVLNSYLGYMWWDNESDAQQMYPRQQRYPTPQDEYNAQIHNPEGAAVRGLWSDRQFLQQTGSPEFNAKLQRVQFADFHGHGWVFRKVFKQDRHGNLLDPDNHPIQPDDPSRFNKAVHLKDIHLEKGMHCVDCHFTQDVHGDGNLYGETRSAVMVECVDCHGDFNAEAALLQYLRMGLSGPSKGKQLLGRLFTGTAAKTSADADRNRRRNQRIAESHFEERNNTLWQRSALYSEGLALARMAGKEDQFKKDARENGMIEGWFVTQTANLTPGPGPADKPDHTTLAVYAHTIRRDNKTWGGAAAPDENGPLLKYAHGPSTMSCYACHSSWNTSCFGCHLPQRANQRKPMLHNEGTISRNYTNYNFQTLRDDVYMLGVDATARGNKIVPIRSACAVMVSSQDAQRQWLYTQQQTVSAEGFAGTAFSPYFPHTVRTTETKQCSDCHLSKKNDNNAILAQLLLQGTNAVNFIGRFAYVGCGDGGVEAVAVTEPTEPQAVIGSTLHKWAYPDFFKQHQGRSLNLQEHYEHAGTVHDVQLRGEYLYAACGPDGFIAYDVANIDNKGFSERIITAPVSPLGQRLYVKSAMATSITSPSTLAIDPTRTREPANLEGRITEIGQPEKVIEPSRPIHLMYAFLYLTDAKEGLIVIGNPLDDKRNKPGVATLLDGDPENNFLQRALTFNPGGLLKGAAHMAFSGHHALVCCDAGIVVLDMDNPLAPRHITTLTGFSSPRRVAIQFRYAFVVDRSGLHVIDITDPAKPVEAPQASLALADARDVYLSRTYAYVAGGREGMLIIDVEAPERPRLVMKYNADGQLNDTHSIRIGMTNSSLFAYVADGKNGLAIVQLTSPDDNPTYMGFSPRPQPRLIARHKTAGPALSISKGLDRDRAVDEDGQQLAVFGRKGARPLTRSEMERLYLRNGQVYTVSDVPPGPALAPTRPATTAPAETKRAESGGIRRPPRRK